MTLLATILVAGPLALLAYTYVGYPALLWVLTRGRSRRRPAAARDFPMVSVCLPAYNEADRIGATLDAWLDAEYPRERMQILVVSDASTDGTDDIVRRYAGRGVELLRVEKRGGKTAAENAAIPHLRGEIIINTDASVRVLPDAVKPLVRAMDDPTVGVASGRDVSVGDVDANRAEGGYVGYEMWVRDLETRHGSIVGASGCYYAIRSELHRRPVQENLSRDFASALTAAEAGYRAVSVPEAICIVPRTNSLRREYRRKVRTMSRGLETLMSRRKLLNPFRHGSFAFKLWSHKLFRWLVPVTLPLMGVGLALLAPRSSFAFVLLVLGVIGAVLGWIGLAWPEAKRPPRLLSTAGFALAANLAAVQAWLRLLNGPGEAIWEPTRRPPAMTGGEERDD